MQDEIEAVNKDSATHKSGQEVNTFEDTFVYIQVKVQVECGGHHHAG